MSYFSARVRKKNKKVFIFCVFLTLINITFLLNKRLVQVVEFTRLKIS